MLKLIRVVSWRLATSPKIASVPSLRAFMNAPSTMDGPLTISTPHPQSDLRFHIETYGCQMNVNDSEIVRSIMSEHYTEINDLKQADIVLINTCAIREKAEERVFNRIRQISRKSTIAVLGCMAERLKAKMFEAGVQVVCGPDAYRDLPRLIGRAVEGESGKMNVMLSAEQTYADIAPIRRDPSSVTAFLSIMRGCNNMCSFCIVPFVRGRERSRNLKTILEEIGKLEEQGVRQITFLGQNVNSYHDLSTQPQEDKLLTLHKHRNSEGFSQTFKLRDHPGARFANLLEESAVAYPNVRFRFTSPHPKDFPEQVLTVIGKYNNICKYIHFPAQSGNNEMLIRMRRNHTREAYVRLAQKMREIPGMALSTDMIAGFCGQTEEEFEDTLSLLREMKYEMAFLFSYSMREKTHAHRNYKDDVSEEVKQRRLKQMIDTFVEVQRGLNLAQVGKLHLLLLQGKAKREEGVLMGKTDNFKNGYVEVTSVPVYQSGKEIDHRPFSLGDYLVVKVEKAAPRSLYCRPIAIASTLSQFYSHPSVFQQLSKESIV